MFTLQVRVAPPLDFSGKNGSQEGKCPFYCFYSFYLYTLYTMIDNMPGKSPSSHQKPPWM